MFNHNCLYYPWYQHFALESEHILNLEPSYMWNKFVKLLQMSQNFFLYHALRIHNSQYHVLAESTREKNVVDYIKNTLFFFFFGFSNESGNKLTDVLPRVWQGCNHNVIQFVCLSLLKGLDPLLTSHCYLEELISL